MRFSPRMGYITVERLTSHGMKAASFLWLSFDGGHVVRALVLGALNSKSNPLTGWF
jgi:hypothetical protein